MGKYDPLRDYLASNEAGDVTMTFAEVERLVGPLPASARLRRSWWANDAKVEAQAWRAADRRVRSVDLAAERVVFDRGAVAGSRAIAPKQARGDPIASVSVRPGITAAGVQSSEIRNSRTKWLVAAVAFVGAISTAAITVAGVSAMPRWALFVSAFDVSLVATAITSAMTERRYRVHALLISNALLAALIAGIAIYNTVPAGRSTVNVVANTDVTLSNQPGDPPDTSNPYATVLTAGVSDTAACYTTVRGMVWLFFHFSDTDYGWAPFEKFSYATGFARHLPANCS
jgi:hypothetical protein